MNGFSTKKSLSTRRRQLLELMQRYNFCRIENLHVHGGEPVFDPPPRITQDIKLGCENDPRPELRQGDFALRAEVIELFQHLDQLDCGQVTLIRVRAGLPCLVEIQREDFGRGGQQASEDSNE